MELSEIQRMHEDFVRERKWDRFPASLVFIHLEEEVAEMGSHILIEEGYKKEGMGNSIHKKDIESECAQVLSLLLQLASAFGVDMEKAFLRELEKNRKRFPAEEWRDYMEEKKET